MNTRALCDNFLKVAAQLATSKTFLNAVQELFSTQSNFSK